MCACMLAVLSNLDPALYEYDYETLHPEPAVPLEPMVACARNKDCRQHFDDPFMVCQSGYCKEKACQGNDNCPIGQSTIFFLLSLTTTISCLMQVKAVSRATVSSPPLAGPSIAKPATPAPLTSSATCREVCAYRVTVRSMRSARVICSAWRDCALGSRAELNQMGMRRERVGRGLPVWQRGEEHKLRRRTIREYYGESSTSCVLLPLLCCSKSFQTLHYTRCVPKQTEMIV